MTYGFTGALLNGINAGASAIDAHFSLPLNGPIDGNRFHRLTFNVLLRRRVQPRRTVPAAACSPALIWQTAGRTGGLAGQRRHRRVPGLEQHLASTSPRHRPGRSPIPNTPLRIGWVGPADHRGAVRPARGLRRRAGSSSTTSGSPRTRPATAARTTSGSTTTPGAPARPRTSTRPRRAAASAARGSRRRSRSTRASTPSAGRRTRSPPATVWVYVVLKRGAYRARTLRERPAADDRVTVTASTA